MFTYEGEIFHSKNQVEQRIADFDARIGAQLDEILHHPEFQALESNWRGLYYLVRESRPGVKLKIKMMSASKRDLLKDFERAAETEVSNLYRKINGDHDFIYGLLVGADGFSGHTLDLSLLQYLSDLGRFANCPFISTPLPEFFGAEDYSSIPKKESLFTGPNNDRWNRLRESDSTRYLGLCWPRILLREPYDLDGPAFKYQETAGGKTLLWGSAAFAFAACIARRFNETGWFRKFSGEDGDGEVENLPAYDLFETGGPDSYKTSLEPGIEPELLPELSALGFMPLFQDSAMENPRFFGNQSVHKPGVYETVSADHDARVCGLMSNILAASRFAHYLIDMVRYCRPAAHTMPRKELEIKLNRWISRYVNEMDETTPEYHAQKPMRECLVQITEIPGQPGRYRGVMFIRPIYLMEAVLVALRLVINFPSQ